MLQVPGEVLEWRFRFPLILQEIRESQADVICLQECNHYGKQAILPRRPPPAQTPAQTPMPTFSLPHVPHVLYNADELYGELSALGYSGLFMPKFCSPAERFNCPADGLAVFFR